MWQLLQRWWAQPFTFRPYVMPSTFSLSFTLQPSAFSLSYTVRTSASVSAMVPSVLIA